jgi:hypothetical protein
MGTEPITAAGDTSGNAFRARPKDDTLILATFGGPSHEVC